METTERALDVDVYQPVSNPFNWQVLNLFASLLFVLYVWDLSQPGSSLFVLLSLPVALCVGVVGLVLPLVRLPRGRGTRAMLVTPVLSAILFLLVWSNAPLESRFGLSKSAFNAQVENLEPGFPSAQWHRIDGLPDRLALYGIDSVERTGEDLVVFFTSSNAGFAYSPDAPPTGVILNRSGWSRFEHIDGAWYSFTVV